MRGLAFPGVMAVVFVFLASPVDARVRVAEPGPDSAMQSAKIFAARLETSLAECDSSFFHSRISFPHLLERGTSDLDVPGIVKTQFAEGVQRGFTLGGDICDAVRATGGYRLLRVRRIDGEVRALFRMLSESGLNYHDYLLSDGQDGPVEILDFYVHTQGEWYSQTLRRGFLPLVGRLGQGSPGHIGNSEHLYLESIPSLLRMQEAYRTGHLQEAIEIFYGLPAEVRENRTVLMQRFAVAVGLGGDEYENAMVDLKNRFSNDPSLDLVLIDHHFNKGEFSTALAMVDRIDRRVGGDPYLDFVRANLLYFGGKHRHAKRLARRAIEQAPELEDPYWTLVTISLEQRNFAETARLLTEIENALGVVLGDLSEIPEYEAFVASKPYDDWLQSRLGR